MFLQKYLTNALNGSPNIYRPFGKMLDPEFGYTRNRARVPKQPNRSDTWPGQMNTDQGKTEPFPPSQTRHRRIGLSVAFLFCIKIQIVIIFPGGHQVLANILLYQTDRSSTLIIPISGWWCRLPGSTCLGRVQNNRRHLRKHHLSHLSNPCSAQIISVKKAVAIKTPSMIRPSSAGLLMQLAETRLNLPDGFAF